MGNSKRSHVFHIALLAVAFLGRGSATATSIDTRPRPTYLFADAKRFLAQDSSVSVAVYNLGDSTPVHRYAGSDHLSTFAVSADERHLLTGNYRARLSCWDLQSGNLIWERTAGQTGLTSVWDLSFSHDGSRCVVCDSRDQALVLDARSGDRVSTIRFPPMQTSIASAALAPDGRTGVFLDQGGRLHTFDATTGSHIDTGLTGATPVRYSADGKYIAFRNNNSGKDEQLRVVAMDGTLRATDVGQASFIAHIRSAPDGTFLVTGQRDRWTTTFGARVRPRDAKWVEFWHRPVDLDMGRRTTLGELTDFDPAQMVGVSTTFHLETTVVDLKTGRVLQQLDNSSGYSSGIKHDFSYWWLVILGVGGAMVVLVVWVVLFRSRRNHQ